MQTDIVVAPARDACFIRCHVPGHWPRLRGEFLDNAAMAALWQTLGASRRMTDALDGLRYMVANSAHRWVFELPLDLVHRLADLPPAACRQVATDWRRHDEMSWMDARRPTLEPLVGDLRLLARQAVSEHKGLFLLMSLER